MHVDYKGSCLSSCLGILLIGCVINPVYKELRKEDIDNHRSGYLGTAIGVSMYTDNFLSQKKLSYLSTEKFLDKTKAPLKSYL